ncbi:ornithine cyclodeaminase family protein [Phreatobacter cathodiphilus]|uniref:Ornithine cyclodeaminase family protein n=1 Tax=Phreatobacter cathodiphilus TaxID=1868589 RepID=A0A2S0N7X3_9HYPH|nr:ornithine cyclodeaminase family protein [Phreatobacter cathodiphilus]AVO44225.1 ornithine cyclodeaminase family protein [Phreatobacter cathodiphilus]
MRIISSAEIAAALSYPALVDALADAFRSDVTVPLRHHHPIPQAAGVPEAMLLLMPAWTPPGDGAFVGTKLVSVYPGNGAKGLPSIYGSYVLCNGETGAPLAILDGTMLTVWRTACASALASRYLSRPDASHMVMVGAGALAPHLIRAHAAIRPIRHVTLWNRSREKANALAEGLGRTVPGVSIAVAGDLQAAVEEADIVTCATISSSPIVSGDWLKPGAHLDLVGGYTPAMREADDAAVTRASLFVDTRTGGLKEAGDIVDPIRRGLIGEADVKADLFDLTRGIHPGRGSAEEITLFKSVGTALEDLAAAMLVWRSLPV